MTKREIDITDILDMLDFTPEHFQELREAEERQKKHTYVLDLIQVLGRVRAAPSHGFEQE